MSATSTPLSGEQPPKRVDFGGDAIQTRSCNDEEAEPNSRRWISNSSRNQTNLEDVVVDIRARRHATLFRRPQALLYKAAEDSSEKGSLVASRTSSNTSSQKDAKDSEERATGDIPKQLKRLDLFVDVLWVGIIANLSTTFGEQAFTDSGVKTSSAMIEFILLFLPIWRIWDYLRAYTSHYYLDDAIQRLFLVWILVLAIFYGINAPFAFRPDGEPTSLTLLLSTYMVARGSFLAALGYQCMFIPILRRQFLFEICTSSVPLGLYIGAIFSPYPGKIVLLFIANALEHPMAIFVASPWGDRLLLPKGVKKVVGIDRFVERYEGFFIIILGEGVFRLIDGSPSGLGINGKTGTVITTMMLFYVLHWLYFNGDQSKRFVHALRRTWWKPVLWQTLHVIMFGSLLCLDSSSFYLVEHLTTKFSDTKSEAEDSNPEESAEVTAHYFLYALWTASISLAVTLFCMTHVALLHRPLDPPKTLVINSRLLRLAPRFPATVIIICLPLFKNMSGAVWCGAAVSILYIIFCFETFAGMERDWRFLEPKNEQDSVLTS